MTTRLGDARVLVLGYHRVGEPGNDVWSLCVRPERFTAQLERICARWQVRGLGDLLRGGASGGTSVVLTFDDGYAETLEIAKPLLDRCGVTATVFLPTGLLGAEHELWWDALEHLLLTPGTLPAGVRACLEGDVPGWPPGETSAFTDQDAARFRGWRAWDPAPSARHELYHRLWSMSGSLDHAERRHMLARLFDAAGADTRPRRNRRLLSPQEAARLRAGPFELGGHTHTHALLSAMSEPQQRAEIMRDRELLVSLGGPSPTSFAYPFGQRHQYTACSTDLVREAGYLGACANFRGIWTRETDPFQIPRVQVHDWDAAEFEHVMNAWIG